jgi:anti-sigma factor RsiW
MLDPKVNDLINRDIDGMLDEGERQKLERLLRRNAPARRLHRELEEVRHVLGSIREVDPPRHLAHRIRAAVHAGDPAVTAPRASREKGIFSLLRSRPTFRFVPSFVGGAVSGIILFVVLSTVLSDQEVSDHAAAGSLASQTETIPINAGGAEGSIAHQHNAGTSEVTLRVATPAGAVSRFEYNPANVRVESLRDADAPGGSVSLREGIVEIRGKGVQKCTLVLSPRIPGAGISYTLEKAEYVLFKAVITVGG